MSLITVVIINMCNYRYMMSWTPDQSSLLSLLLDEVVGTQENIDIRQDFCRLWESNFSNHLNGTVYFAGSKAEGLDLPGSDEDYMMDLNTSFKNAHCPMKVIQTLNDIEDTSSLEIFLMCTENIPPCFALLQYVNPSLMFMMLPWHQINNGIIYCSSNLLVQHWYNMLTTDNAQTSFGNPYTIPIRRQGPSLEHWSPFPYESETGKDLVMSLHCTFWPHCASEWVQRPRRFGWPTSQDVSSVIEFGCHLVPVGHPHSETKLAEWRISFSLAERALVWSFNHVQMQCYAVMKLILKEFIKIKCSTQNFILCSYFIKTFLFWKYEATDLSFWSPENLRECIKVLLIEFSQCIRKGILQHYFIPTFNLLSVKLTQEAQVELLQLYDIAIQYDMNILRECKTLKSVWIAFLSANENTGIVRSNLERKDMLKNDQYLIKELFNFFDNYDSGRVEFGIRQAPAPRTEVGKYLTVYCKTPLKDFVIKQYLQRFEIRGLTSLCPGNRKTYQFQKISKALSIDVSTVHLWHSFFLFVKGAYTETLITVNQMLSNITPFTLYFRPNDTDNHFSGSTEAKELYKDIFGESRKTISQRAKRAWLFDVQCFNDMSPIMPLAIQIELEMCKHLRCVVELSPFACAYYLMFLCYHELRQYDERDHALRQLLDVVNNPMQSGTIPYRNINIAGHCLFMAGKTTQARHFFIGSYKLTKFLPLHKTLNSAAFYLRRLFNIDVLLI